MISLKRAWEDLKKNVLFSQDVESVALKNEPKLSTKRYFLAKCLHLRLNYPIEGYRQECKLHTYVFFF